MMQATHEEVEKAKARIEALHSPEGSARTIAKIDAAQLDKVACTRLAKTVYGAGNNKARVFWMHRLADKFVENVYPLSACSKAIGACSDCCYQSVLMSEAEAHYIANEMGKKTTEPKDARVANEAFEGFGKELRDKWTGTPCVFLGADGLCSIYRVRPVACRTHLSLDEDALLCGPAGDGLWGIPYVNAMPIIMIQAQAFGPHMRYADIRDWFKART